MIVEGGAVLFTDEVLKDEKNIRKLIYNILKDTDTSIEIIALNDTRRRGLDFSCIFKITFNKKFDTYFKTISNSIYNITAPRVLIIKLLIGYPHDEVANEVAIHKTLGAQTNILPICPSFLFHEEINNTTMTTNIGSAFYDLLKFKSNKEHYEEFCNFINNNEPKTSAKLQNMFIMEFIECTSYTDFYEKTLTDTAGKTRTNRSFYRYITLDTEIKLSCINRSQELRNFYTYYMASLLAIKGFHHSDIHSDNVMICSNIEIITSVPDENQLNIERTNIFPFVIDFGRAGSITSEELVFQELRTERGIKKFKLNKLTEEPPFDREKYLRLIYLDAKKNKTSIVDHVTRLLGEGNYVDAVLTISMCVNPKSGANYPSLFVGYYDFGHDPYMDLYLINKDRKEKYNEMISKLIKKREQLELETQLIETKEDPIARVSRTINPEDTQYRGLDKSEPGSISKDGFVEVDGGKLVLKRQKKSKTKKSKTKKTKSKKSKSKNSKTKKTNTH